MNNKKLLKLLILFSSLVSLSACSNGESSTSDITTSEPTTSTSGETPVDPEPEDERFEEERNALLRRLTFSDEEYKYYLNKEVTYAYKNYDKTNLDNEFLSREHRTFHVNDKDVDVNIFYIPYYTNLNHPNVGMGLLLYKAILYKLKNPNKENEITLTSFRLSSIAGINLVKSSKYYGTMKNMPDEVMDKDGFVRFTYLMYFAAKIGIKIHVVTQLGGYSNYGTEIYPEDFFPTIMEDPCSEKHGIHDKKVKDFLTHSHFEWYGYDEDSVKDKAATDLMHNKILTVLHYLGEDGKVHDYTSYSSSSNLDGVRDNGVAGCVKSQTGVIISNHEYIYRCFNNFTNFSCNYTGQYDAPLFRVAYKEKIDEQREIIKTSGYDSIKDEMMLYLGTEKDKVFELSIAPLPGGTGDWTSDNIICKYIDKLAASKKAIKCQWVNAKFATNSTFITSICQKIISAFKVARSQLEREKCFLYVKAQQDIGTTFDELEEGKHLDKKIIISNSSAPHQKDFLLEYTENDKKCTTMLLTTANNHTGGYFYQINTFLAINENEDIGTTLYDEMAYLYTVYEYSR